MKTPIDLAALPRPVKPKYLDEETPALATWIIFGEHPNGNVDIHSFVDGVDIFTNVPRAEADRIIAARERFAAEIVAIINREPGA